MTAVAVKGQAEDNAKEMPKFFPICIVEAQLALLIPATIARNEETGFHEER